MWRLAQQQDIPAIERFLLDHVQSSMFALANLREFGLNAPAPRAMSMWMLGDPLRGVFGITNEGMILPQCPDLPEADLTAAADLIRGRTVMGLAGEASQARRFLRQAGWQDRAAHLDRDEPSFALDLRDLIVPPTENARLVPLSDGDRSLLIRWREAYHLESLGTDPGMARKAAQKDIDGCIQRDSHRLLMVDDLPVSMTGFNATLPEIVQIGGVFTPPALRGWGYARTAVALHLAEARAAGVRKAVLFAASNAAVRAYVAIGFAPAGTFSLVLFSDQMEAAS
ncbi:GNAT family N-acetyltransferase [Ruegeria arenilitoris]|uniref:GNAT family N-acetyltransferase n=1 Tax=Ruegeria arenilitoris TaxID=1173585 RepID=UPI00147BEFF3|nr:N-acetyltransferase [Ruegeria arenilitoris]